MKLTVLNVTYPLTPVGPNGVGGAEQVLTQLDTALTKVRHHSTVIAGAGSVTKGTLLATTGPLNEQVILATQDAIRHAIRHAIPAALPAPAT